MSAVTTIELIARLLLLGAGFGVAVHYHLMANFLQRAPHVVRAVFLPVATAGGVGMIVCGATGSLLGGLLSSGVGVTAVVLVNLAAWGAGMHVSAAFDAAAQSHIDRTNQILGRVKAYADGVGQSVNDQPLFTESGWAAFEESTRRAKERA